MILAIDAGNSSVEFAIYNGEELISKFRTVTSKQKSRDEYMVILNNLLSIHGIDKNQITAAAISSVVPELNNGLMSLTRTLFNVEPLLVGPGFKTGVIVKADNPQEVGSDLVMGVVGALKYNYETFVVIDLGTATTFTIVENKNTIIGASIAPGVRLGLDSLVGKSSLLKTMEIKAPKSVIGKNTTESLQSGAVFGHVAMIEGMMERIRSELGKDVDVIITGGLAKTISQNLKCNPTIGENLILEGLVKTYERN